MNELQKAIRQQIITFVTAAFGFVAGLAWNEAIQGLINKVFEMEGNSIAAKFIYALIITIVATLVIVSLGRLGNKEEAKSN